MSKVNAPCTWNIPERGMSLQILLCMYLLLFVFNYHYLGNLQTDVEYVQADLNILELEGFCKEERGASNRVGAPGTRILYTDYMFT